LLGAIDSLTFTEFPDTIDTANLLDINCGLKTYAIHYALDDSLFDLNDYSGLGETFLLLSDDSATVPVHTLTLDPDNSGFPIEGPINMYFSVTLTDWSSVTANTASTFTYEITVCEITSINPHIRSDEVYVVHDVAKDFTITPWTQTPLCAYTITYTAFLIVSGIS